MLINLSSMIRKQGGLTLIEMMIALAIGVIVLVVLLSIYLNFLQHSRDQLNSGRLFQQLQAAMNIMVSDIRRAGYWSSATSDVGTGANTNPFMSSATDISINAANNCILFSYDKSANGSLPAINTGTDDERYGFRLSNNAIQSRPTSAAFDCAASSASWVNITDPAIIKVTNLTFSQIIKNLSISGTSAILKIRYVDITLSGQLTNNSAITATLAQRIRVTNDKFVP